MNIIESSQLKWDFDDPFVAQVEVKRSHTDALNHTNNSVYIKWCEDISWIHSQVLGVGLDAFLDFDAGMAITHSEWDYYRPSFIGDVLQVATWVRNFDGKYKAERWFQIARVSDGKTLLKGHAKFACVDLNTGRPRRVPDLYYRAYKPFLIDQS